MDAVGPLETSEDVLDWTSLYRSRLDWALDAREQFLESLESEAIASSVATVSQSDRREVVVVGRSQVGKTTLILRLQGVTSPDAQSRLEEVLRGGREYGNSATAVASVFGVAPGNRFRLQRPGEDSPQVLSDEDMKSRMAELRREVEAGGVNARRVVRIEIPQEAVDQPVESSGLDVVDLPGIDGRDPSERRHAEALVKSHLLRAHLVLLVGKPDGITHLRSALDGDAYGIGNRAWMYQPSRFAIVLTHATTPASIQEKLSNLDLSREEEYVQFYRDLIRKDWTDHASTPESADVVASLPLFPVELGAAEHHLSDEMQKRLQEWSDSRIENLLNRIHQAASPVADLRFLIGAFHGAKKRAEIEEKTFREELEELKNERADYNSLADAARQEREYIRGKAKGLEQKKNSVPSPRDIVRDIEIEPPYPSKTMRRSKIYQYLKRERYNILRYVDTMMDKIEHLSRLHRGNPMNVWSRDKARDAAKAEIDKKLDPVFSSLQDNLTGLLVDTKKWKKRAGKAVREAGGCVESRCKSIAQDCVQVMKEGYDQEIKSYDAELQDAYRLEENHLENVETIDRRIEERKRRHEEASARIQKDLARWENLEERFEHAFHAELETVMKRMRRATSAANHVFLMAYTRVLRETMHALKRGRVQ